MTSAPPRERCQQHGLLYDPRLMRGCALCRRATQTDPVREASPGLSWLRVVGSVLATLIVLVLAWQYPPLSSWVLGSLRASFVAGPNTAAAISGAFDPEIWQQASRHLEPLQLGADEGERLAALGVQSYVPRDNLVSIEGRVTGRRPNRSEIVDALRRLDTALLRYPLRFIQAAGFEHLVWLCEVVKDGAPVRGFAMPPAKTLVLDPSAFEAGILHHELFHMVDYRLHGDAADAAWQALNPQGSVYAGITDYAKQLRAQPSGASVPAHFITDYARATPAEDRAEMFRVLMSDPALAAARRSANVTLDAKARYIMAAVDQLASGSSVALGLH